MSQDRPTTGFSGTAVTVFPLPDYDLSQPERVMVTLRGHILDVRYPRLLRAQGELDLAAIMLLDKLLLDINGSTSVTY